MIGASMTSVTTLTQTNLLTSNKLSITGYDRDSLGKESTESTFA